MDSKCVHLCFRDILHVSLSLYGCIYMRVSLGHLAGYTNLSSRMYTCRCLPRNGIWHARCYNEWLGCIQFCPTSCSSFVKPSFLYVYCWYISIISEIVITLFVCIIPRLQCRETIDNSYFFQVLGLSMSEILTVPERPHSRVTANAMGTWDKSLFILQVGPPRWSNYPI